MSTYVNAVSSADSDEDADVEVECKRCHGTGEDRDRADCVHCDGFGTVLLGG
jgi:DnaJ-class molecular chaperone